MKPVQLIGPLAFVLLLSTTAAAAVPGGLCRWLGFGWGPGYHAGPTKAYPPNPMYGAIYGPMYGPMYGPNHRPMHYPALPPHRAVPEPVLPPPIDNPTPPSPRIEQPGRSAMHPTSNPAGVAPRR